ncbi:MAG: bifunctional adenosylcobinamide kinase/adenosylcobinamide-phosphate guanylyltransferase [Abditibacteriota bacterium]|nr:bifunctional adenosylcobinamide kinase/adenosylcobinamide-phosphate guanylyltransferase [Abditibacteriota bacterium]
MELIIGGRSQGKLQFALTLHGLTPDSAADGELTPKPVIYNLQSWVRQALAEKRDPEAELLAFADRHPDTVFVCDQLGCGVVPAEPENRLWRDVTGRLCCLLAARADRVYRVTAGIGQRIK